MGRNKLEKSNLSINKTAANPDFLEAECSYLKSKNLELAKCLSETKKLLREREQESNYLKNEIMELMGKNRSLTSRYNKMRELAKNVFADFFNLSHKMEEMMVLSSKPEYEPEMERMTEQNKSTKSTPDTSMRMQAVKPMVSGHVIHRPTINLRRMPAEELERIGANFSVSQHNSSVETAEVVNENGEELDEVLENGESENNSSVEQPQTVIRLHTLQEESENESSSTGEIMGTSTSAPLLSGIFNDVNVRVYLSQPDLPNLPIIAENHRHTPLLTSNNSMPSTSFDESWRSNDKAVSTRKNKRPFISPPLTSPRPVLPKKRRNITPVNSTISLNGNSRFSLSSREDTQSNPTLSQNSMLVNNCSSGNTLSDFDSQGSLTLRGISNINNEDTLMNNHESRSAAEMKEYSLKVESMKLLGLSPSYKQLPTSTPYSPVRKTRSAFKPTPDSTPKLKGKKKNFPKMPTCKVMLKRLPAKRKSQSPMKNKSRNSLEGSSSSVNEAMKNNNELSTNNTMVKTEVITPRRGRPKRVNKPKSYKEPERKRTNETSPNKPQYGGIGRPRRASKPVNLKEPSVGRKMRRT